MRLIAIALLLLLLTACIRGGKVKDHGAEELYYERCSTCHSASNPDKYNAKEWLGILESMQVHSGLNKSEYKKIHQYLLSNSKKSKSE